ncbi:molecular chaperone HscC [Lysobacter sp. 5GHs7-4]|uniref:molecular chaperone HscC n=1 Tax=Lysobacter sp. 5GHs7-4 TaxID=2904253 RepID=UPI001E62FF0D|nr:molecular chaperone HscC [Lysobacter sp. 5GHs7-4]UHQ24950.1 molecular chaperone HscC [Lysobacter sp. 5GHs7-4]
MIVGIDLGTTHSLIGQYGPDGPKLIPNALGELLTPSVVSVDDDGAIIVGRAAQERMVSHPQRSVGAFKRWMGTDRRTALGQHAFRPEELSALILKSLLADAQAHLGERIDEAVISVPAYFSDSQRKATRIAGELAGIKVERLINEPTAAALAYGLQQRSEGRYLVFDLGGGTFDVSILEMFEGVMEVHASAGDNFLGGEDFSRAMRDAFLRDQDLPLERLTLAELAQLERRLELAKRELAHGHEAVVELSLQREPRRWRIDEHAFAQLCDPLVQRLRAPLERAMRDAKLRPDQLDEIVLVGGASRMPLAARLVSRMFGRLPLRHVNPDEAIAMGACVAAGMKARDESLEEIILTDVCPHTLGVNTAEETGNGQHVSGVFSPIIHRNSTVPVSRVERYYPLRDGQREVEFEIYQGESPRVENNVRLGKVSIEIPAKRRNENPVDIRFTYDINGLLQVEATALSTGLTREVVLEKNPGVLSPEEIRVRLAALTAIKIHPRDQQENIAVIARAERLYEELLWARDQLQSALVRFRTLLDSQDLRDIAEQRSQFAAFLDQVEAQGYA